MPVPYSQRSSITQEEIEPLLTDIQITPDAVSDLRTTLTGTEIAITSTTLTEDNNGDGIFFYPSLKLTENGLSSTTADSVLNTGEYTFQADAGWKSNTTIRCPVFKLEAPATTSTLNEISFNSKFTNPGTLTPGLHIENTTDDMKFKINDGDFVQRFSNTFTTSLSVSVVPTCAALTDGAAELNIESATAQSLEVKSTTLTGDANDGMDGITFYPTLDILPNGFQFKTENSVLYGDGKFSLIVEDSVFKSEIGMHIPQIIMPAPGTTNTTDFTEIRNNFYENNNNTRIYGCKIVSPYFKLNDSSKVSEIEATLTNSTEKLATSSAIYNAIDTAIDNQAPSTVNASYSIRSPRFNLSEYTAPSGTTDRAYIGFDSVEEGDTINKLYGSDSAGEDCLEFDFPKMKFGGHYITSFEKIYAVITNYDNNLMNWGDGFPEDGELPTDLTNDYRVFDSWDVSSLTNNSHFSSNSGYNTKGPFSPSSPNVSTSHTSNGAHEIVFNTAGVYRISCTISFYNAHNLYLPPSGAAVLAARLIKERSNVVTSLASGFSGIMFSNHHGGPLHLECITEIQENDILSVVTCRSGSDQYTNQSQWLDSQGNDVYVDHGFRQQLLKTNAGQSQLIIQKL